MVAAVATPKVAPEVPALKAAAGSTSKPTSAPAVHDGTRTARKRTVP